MVRALDDRLAFKTYCRRLEYSPATQDILTHIRSSLPARRARANAGNEVVTFPSPKMGLMLEVESGKVEFAYLLLLEFDDLVYEIYNQPPSIQLEYLDLHDQLRRPWHTADYFVFRYDSAGWVECKPLDRLVKLAQEKPSRYMVDESGKWHCPPGEVYAEKLGLKYEIWVADDINWDIQSNWLYLTPYYQDLEQLSVPEQVLDALYDLVEATPGIGLAKLRHALQEKTDIQYDKMLTKGIPADLINIAIAQNLLYVDLTRYRLSDQHRRHVPVYLDKAAALGAPLPRQQQDDPCLDARPVVVETNAPVVWNGKTWQIKTLGETDILLLDEEGQPFSLPYKAFEAYVKEGKIAGARWRERSYFTDEGAEKLDRASPQAIATANFRNRVIYPEDFDDEEQDRNEAKRAAVSERTKRLWRHLYREAEIKYGNGYIGLLPDYQECGRPGIDPKDKELIKRAKEKCYDTPARPPKRGAYGEYLLLCKAQDPSRTPINQSTFYDHFHRLKNKYDETVVREGTRAAYPYKQPHRSKKRELARHGQSAWEHAYLDHFLIDEMLLDSETGAELGKCWMTMLILGHPRRFAAYALSFDEPSYRSCLMVLRLCVKRFGRLPDSITVDGGPEFHSQYFDKFLATFKIRKHRRPKSEPRFGSVQERLGLTMNTEFINHLLGNTQARKNPRTQTKATDPSRLTHWTLPALAERVQEWADEVYDTIEHPALKGLTPRQAYEQSIERDGLREHKLIPYDLTFLRQTYPSTRSEKALVQPGAGVRIQYIDYWCEEMGDADVEGTIVPVRYDPFDRSKAYAYILGQWRLCQSALNEFADCTEREIQLMAEEIRQSERLQHGRVRIEITQEKLAEFRRKNVDKQGLQARQKKDRETKKAYSFLEGGRASPTVQDPVPPFQVMTAGSNVEPEEETFDEEAAPNQDTPDLSKLIVFRRHR